MRKLIYVMTAILGIAGIFVIGLYIQTQNRVRELDPGSDGYRTYNRHYLFVSSDVSRMLTDIYERCSQSCEKSGAWLEWCGKETPGNYSAADCIDISIAMKADGIIVYPDGSDNLSGAITRASEAGIPVITVLRDLPDSDRVSYVGVSNYQMGDIAEVDVTPSGFLRVAAQTAKQVIIQHIREAERGKIYDEYIEKENEIMTGIVERIEPKAVYVDLGRTEGVLDRDEMIPGEVLHDEDHIKVYILEVHKTSQNAGYTPQVYVSRIHPNLVKRLFEMEVPEIAGGIVTIKNIAREAGSRTKIAVHSSDVMIDPVGACVGQRGGRVDRVVTELKGEKIDIIKWSSNPAEFVANALNPAHVLSVYQARDEKAFRVIVPDNQLSLAIGKEGQNARLAAKLTGWKIDIKSQSQAAEMDDMVDENGEMTEYVQVETPTYDSFTMDFDASLSGDDDTM